MKAKNEKTNLSNSFFVKNFIYLILVLQAILNSFGY